MGEKKLYIYEGPVKYFDNVIQDVWIRGTQAVSEAKALANLQYCYKRRKKMAASSRITLDKAFLRIEEGYICKN